MLSSMSGRRNTRSCQWGLGCLACCCASAPDWRTSTLSRSSPSHFLASAAQFLVRLEGVTTIAFLATGFPCTLALLGQKGSVPFPDIHPATCLFVAHTVQLCAQTALFDNLAHPFHGSHTSSLIACETQIIHCGAKC